MKSSAAWLGKLPCLVPMIAFVLLFHVACAKHRVPVSVAANPIEPASGEVSFRILPDEDSGKRQDPRGWEYHPPRLKGETAMPSYPERPLAMKFGKAIVIVRIVVSPNGEVTEVNPRPGSTGGPFYLDFFQAVEAAVRKWKFTPPEWWQLEEGSDINGDGVPDYQSVTSIKPTSATGDVQFIFELIRGQPQVRQK